MRLTEHQALALLEGRETVHLECKSAKGGLPGSVWETYSAFSNTDGGVILLGVSEQAGRFFVSGVDDVDALQKNFWATVKGRSKVSHCTLQDRDVYPVQIGDKRILAVVVPRAPRQIRPIYLDGDIFGATFVRLHEGDFRCDAFAVKRMIADQSDTTDSEIILGTSLSDLDRSSLSGYRQQFRLMRPTHPYNDLEDRDFLEKLNGYVRDYRTGDEGLTKAGLLMFGDLSSILKHIPNYIVDYREYVETESPTSRWIDRLTTDFSWPGNLYRFCQTVIQKLYLGIKIPFKLDGWQRIDDSPTHVAVREAVVNAIIHADYGERTAILIERRPDRFVFRNPGLLRMSLDEVYSGGISDCRNRALQKMFQMVGFSEQAGSGFPKIFHGWGENQHLMRPQLRELSTARATELTFVLSEASVRENGETITKTDETTKENGETISKSGVSGVETTNKTIGTTNKNGVRGEGTTNKTTGTTNKNGVRGEETTNKTTVTTNKNGVRGEETTNKTTGTTNKNGVRGEETTNKTTGTTNENGGSTNENGGEAEISTRQEIIALLLEDPDMVVDELARRIGISANGVRYHMKELRKAGIVIRKGSKKTGRWVVLPRGNCAT